MTLLPKGSEEGSQYEPSEIFHLKPNTPVQFQLFTSHTRLHDQPGDLIAVDAAEMQPLPAIRTVLRFGKGQGGHGPVIPVHLSAALTEIGTLDLQLKAIQTPHQWKLEFQLRSETGQENYLANLAGARSDETLDAEMMQEAQSLIVDAFSPANKTLLAKLPELLEQTLGQNKRQWAPSTMRGLWDGVMKQASHRQLSIEHSIRWWNLIGFLLRPGFGYPLDDHRIKELWRVILGELPSQRAQECLIQMSICYRRIAGGLNKRTADPACK